MNRLYRLTHVALMLISTAAVADSGRSDPGALWELACGPAFSTEEDSRETQKRLAELARVDRKRREEAYRDALKRWDEQQREAEQHRRETLRTRF